MNKLMAIGLMTALGCHGSHGHGHGEEAGSVQATAWGEHSELFAEYAPLVAGVASDTAIHVTRMSDFSALEKGSVTIELSQAGGAPVSVSADAPARAGIFTPAITPGAAGPCKLTIVVRTEAWTDRFELPECQVHAKAPKPAEEDEGLITFLKEQQWTAGFGTMIAADRPLQPTVRVNAEIKPVTGREAHLTAALPGRVQFGPEPPVLGMAVAKGQLLATVTPPLKGATNRASISAELVAARAELAAAKADKERVDRLAGQEAISARRVQEAVARHSVARSRVQASQELLREYDASASGRGKSRNTFRVRSPLDGTLVGVDVTSGETVAGGHHLFTVIDVSKVWVEGRVFEPDIPGVLDAKKASFTVEGYDKPFSIDERNGRLITVGRVLDTESRTVPIVFEVSNPDTRLRIGQFAELEIATGTPASTLAVPGSAILTDGGRSVVFVQRGGESFERRFIKTGLVSQGWVAVASGLKAGERVVIRGAHLVKLASAAKAAPGHGHSH